MDLSHLKFEAPGPGIWRTDGLHTYRPISAMKMAAYANMEAGFRIGSSRYGLLGDGMRIAVLHRFVYIQPRSLVPRPPGEEEVAHARFQALAAANPEVKERFQKAEEAFSTKLWLKDAEHWDKIGRPWLLGRTLELTDVEPRNLADEALCAHLEECLYHLGRALEYHHILNPILISRGLLFFRATEWSGCTSDELELLMVGSSPISAGDEPELRALTEALQGDKTALAIIEGDDSHEDQLAALCARGGAVGEAAREYVRVVGYRTIIGWEPMEPYILERPGDLLAKIRHGLSAEYPKLNPDDVAGVRDKIADEHRAEFDELLADARALSRIKDERDLYCNMPISGVLRRGVIEAGRRGCERGRIDDVEHMTEASLGEIRQILADDGGPTAGQLEERHDYRSTYSIRDIPETLGEPDRLPVPPEWLPGASRILASLSGGRPVVESGQEQELIGLKGNGASPGVYEGTARVLEGSAHLGRIEQGAVLITTAANPAFNVILPQLGAIVTEYGGILSHAGIIAREFGLPAVVGCKGVMAKINDGDRVRVNGGTGEVSVLS